MFSDRQFMIQLPNPQSSFGSKLLQTAGFHSLKNLILLNHNKNPSAYVYLNLFSKSLGKYIQNASCELATQHSTWAAVILMKSIFEKRKIHSS